MTRFSRTLLVLALVVALAPAGCSSNDTGKTDGGGNTDSAVQPTGLDCSSGDCTDFVFDSLLLPATNAEAKEYAIDFDGNGTKDNQLGLILSALTNIVPDLALQDSINESVNEGKTVVLLRVQAKDLTSAPQAAAQAWLGATVDCCPTDKDPARCAEETKTTCHKGDFEFGIAGDSPGDAVFGGAISGGAADFGPSILKLKLPLSGGELDLNLKMARLVVKFEDGKIARSTLAGGITEHDLDNSVLPSVHAMLQETARNGTEETKKQVLDLFDKDPQDGEISLDEVKNHEVIKAFLQGDVDVNGDGTLELSLGVGFTAVPARIDAD